MAAGARVVTRTAAALALAAAVTVGAGSAAAAPVGLRGEVTRLSAAAAALRRTLPVQASDAARIEVRLGRLEEELRRLTGRIEQLEYGQQNVERRLDRLIGDLDRRLRDFEEGGAPTAAVTTPATPSPTPAPPPAPAPRPAAVAEASPVPAPAESGDQTLGQVPESALLALPARPAPDQTTPPQTTSLPPQAQYDAAMDLLRAGDYGSAERALQLFLDLNPDHPLAANAAYWQAETYYVRKNYAAAAAAFARNYRTYGKQATKAPDNLLKLGMSLAGLGESEKACLSYDELAREFPDPPAHIGQALTRERSRAGCG